MTSLFHREDRGRLDLGEIRKMLQRLRTSPATVRLAVGYGVQLANSEFIRRFGDLESFRRLSEQGRRLFSKDLSDLELSLRSHEPGAALGVGLYRIWLADSLAERREAAEILGEELTELSRKACVGP